MARHPHTELRPGLAILQSNRMEDLRVLLLDWIRNNPLPPFETETILVQSNGMAQWLKLGFAADEGLGISADIQTLLPSTFLWRTYRRVLSNQPIPVESPLDREPMTWRLFGLLPELAKDTEVLYEPLRKFLKDDPRQERRYQLASQLAALFDQYQVYRPDWLRAWNDNINADDIQIPEGQQWQPPVWRKLVEPLNDQGNSTSRALLNDQLVSELNRLSECQLALPAGLPRRLILFGISSLPGQTLDAIRALSQRVQVLYFVHNPCQHYWADIMDARESAQIALRTRLKRHAHRLDGVPPAPETLHLEGNPLLAAWGKQGRDFVRLLDQWDSPESYQSWFQQIDVFEEVPEAKARLLHQVQNAILNRDPLPASKQERRPVSPHDDSISFQIVHTRQREIEVLHDQLLRLFDQKNGTCSELTPRDVIIMVPNVDHYAPHIQAVFGQIPVTDPRYIPFSIADRRQRGHNPIHLSLEYLLNLPEARMTASEILDLLDVDAIRRRFDLKEADLPLLKRWIMDAGVRWGLDGQHRGPLDPSLNLEQNSWKFGLDRMALGYCMGAIQNTNDLAPLGDVGGIEGDRLGPLWLFVEALSRHQAELAESASPAIWGDRLRRLMSAFFDPVNKDDRQSLERLEQSLAQWLGYCEQAGLTDDLHLSVVREAWLASVDTPNLNQRFLAGRVNFCTLMPMRSIPFKVVCLLGMNDAEFPRIQPRRAFDLMSLPGAYRPGDRSRRDDDRYMFLEALLSAREKLIVSWIGRDVRDDANLPPSVLVNQFRDYLEGGWRPDSEDPVSPATELLDQLTVTHGLQPFSPLYFKGGSPHFSYAREWRTTLAQQAQPAGETPIKPLSAVEKHEPLTLLKLERFLKNPSQSFFEQRLGVYFRDDERTTEDVETFDLNPLQRHIMSNDMLKAALHHPGVEGSDLEAASRRLQLSGELPMGGFGDNTLGGLRDNALIMSQRYASLLEQGWSSQVTAPLAIQLAPFGEAGSASLNIEDWLTDLRVKQDDASRHARIEFRPSAILNKDAPKRHPLVGLWIRHLTANAMGCNLTSYLIAPDATLSLQALTAADARSGLEAIVDGWQAGLNHPLPVALKTSLAWLAAEEDTREAKAITTYEGDGYHTQGEVETSDYLFRAYPTAETLMTPRDREPDFETWTQRLYQPLHAATLTTEEDT